MNHKLFYRGLALALALLLALPVLALAEDISTESLEAPDIEASFVDATPAEINEILGYANETDPSTELTESTETTSTEPISISINDRKPVLHLGYSIELETTLDPTNASTTLKWKSSKKKVAKVDAATGKITARKTGKTKITVTTANGKKDTVTLTVKKNKLSGINKKLTKKSLRQAGKNCLIRLKSMEIKPNGKMVCEFYFISSLRRVVRLTNLNISIGVSTSSGTYRIAHHTFSKVKINSSRNRCKTIKLTFPAKDVEKLLGVNFPVYALSAGNVVEDATARVWYLK